MTGEENELEPNKREVNGKSGKRKYENTLQGGGKSVRKKKE